ncbi:MAG: TerC family protein [Planctomycetota bacterium]|nr:TerC family protein [Planctomycetota bacterium]
MHLWLYAGFVAFVLVMLALDLGVLNRGAHVFSAKRALAFTGVTIVLALAFGGFVYWAYDTDFAGLGTQFRQLETPLGGHGAAQEPGAPIDPATPQIQELSHSVGRQALTQYITGWLVEYSLSLDNIFVIALIFGFFKVPQAYQHRVLFWGVLGALILRGIMIFAGAALLTRFSWMTYVFGGFLLLTAVKLMLSGEGEVHPDRNWAVRLARKMYPVSRDYEGQNFFTRVDGKRAITPLFLVLLVVETTDVIFAVDSIPAIFGITRDPFLVFTSNVFAILGLRSLYFALAAVMGLFRFLKQSLVFVLAFVGVKMLLASVYHIDAILSLAIILGILGVGVVASLVARKPVTPEATADDGSMPHA